MSRYVRKILHKSYIKLYSFLHTLLSILGYNNHRKNKEDEMIDIGRLTKNDSELLKGFVNKMGLEGVIIVSSDGLEMASYFNNDGDADLISAYTASLLSILQGILKNIGKEGFREMIINSEGGSIAIKDLGDDLSLVCITPKGYKMGSLVVSLKQFMKEIED